MSAMKPKARHLHRAKAPAKTRGANLSAQPDLGVASHALFDLDAGRGERDTRAEGSVEDPLGDWPDVPGECDRWLLERGTSPAEPQHVDDDAVVPRDEVDR